MRPGSSRTQSIALVGLPGSGKTAVGRRLAERLALPFVDSDAEVERAERLSVAAVFERFGEAGFRERERRAVAALLDGGPKVIATGGGAFADAQSRRRLLERCTVVWLDAPVETLANRLAGNPDRPLLAGRDLAEALLHLAAERSALYAKAHHRIAAEGSPDEVAERVAAVIR